jgi:uncharacterized delta-60 repeat protein
MKKFKDIKHSANFLFTLLLLSICFTACKKTEPLPQDPYAGGKEGLAIKFLSNAAIVEGNSMTFSATGLIPYKDKLHLLINSVEATITAVTANSVTVTVPNNISSGPAVIIVDDQIFFGPMVSVSGKTEVDPTFSALGANSSISQVLPLPNGNLMMVGSFTNYAQAASEKQPINSIVLTNQNGTYLNTLSSRKGANGSINAIARLSNGQFMIAGGFSSFNNRKGMSGITRLNSNGSLDTARVEVVNLTPLIPNNSYDTVARFNGGISGTASKLFIYNNQIIVQGNFNNYAEYFYERSTRDRKVVGYTKVNNVLRMSMEGKMDSTYNFDKAAGTPLEAGNGNIYDAALQPDGKMIMVGSFTRYQAQAASYILRLDINGRVDPSFNASANAPINSVRYNATNGKYMLAGAFTTYNGVQVNGLVRINADGSIDPSFNALGMSGGFPTFAAQLSGGKIIVSGNFTNYNNIIRQGFMILNADGSLAEGYNNTGRFIGSISDIYEKTNSLGYPTVIIAGFISTFDARPANNIIRIVLKP